MKARSPGCVEHQRSNAAVHSAIRAKSLISWHPSIAVQYTWPAMIGDASPAITRTIASSSIARPSLTRPP